MNQLQGDKFLVRKKVMQLIGGSFEVFDENENLVMFASQKGFKMKEDIRLFNDAEKTTELLRIAARNIIDFSAIYDVVDSSNDQIIGSVQRQGLKSILKDHWTIMDKDGNVVANLHEDNKLLALVRRYVTNLVPQTYHIYNMENQATTELKRNFNPFVSKINIDFSFGVEEKMDKRIGIAIAILMTAIESKQG